MKGAKELKIIVMVLTKKIFVRRKWIILGLKMMQCHKSRSTLRVFFSFAQ